ncbi:MAG: PP2C family protein-serine/threonine phosphatase [Candidatus Odinarchaeota archaeon]
MSRPVKFLGKDYPELKKYEHRRIEFKPFTAEITITAGKVFDPGKKVHVNEDAALLIPPPEKESAPGLLAVADAHWGREAAEIAINTLEDVFTGFYWTGEERETELEERLQDLVRDALMAMVQAHTTSETALVAGFLFDDAFHWISFGDCFIYAFPPGKPGYTVNETLDAWLGLRVAGIYSDYMVSGNLFLENGVSLLLATDGLPEAVYGTPTISVSEMRTIIDENPNKPLVALTEAALTAGGEDNLAAVLVRLDH